MQNQFSGKTLSEVAREVRLGAPGAGGSPPTQPNKRMMEQFIDRMAMANDRLLNSTMAISNMNDKLMGGQPEPASEKLDSGASLLSALDYQMTIYEQRLTRLGRELERLDTL